jgi:hypothetical protein
MLPVFESRGGEEESNLVRINHIADPAIGHAARREYSHPSRESGTMSHWLGTNYRAECSIESFVAG